MAVASTASCGETAVSVRVDPSIFAPVGTPSRSDVYRSSPEPLSGRELIGSGNGRAQLTVGPLRKDRLGFAPARLSSTTTRFRPLPSNSPRACYNDIVDRRYAASATALSTMTLWFNYAAGEIRSFSAIFTKSASEPAFILRIT